MKPLLCIITLLVFAFAPGFGQNTIDYRYLQSPIKNQKDRGTCTAFSICAALETQPGIPTDLSEQYLYAKAKFTHYMQKEDLAGVEGEMLEYYIDILQSNGVISESKMPYDETAVRYSSDKDMLQRYSDVTKGASLYDMFKYYNVTYKLNKDAYLVYAGHDAQDTANIKYWLAAGIKAIPVAYNINSAFWGPRTKSNNLLTPDSMMGVWVNDKLYYYSAARQLVPDLRTKLEDSLVKVQPLWSNGVFDGGHAVTIVGYNDEGFIIKNSWGKNWGDGGYAVVSYDYHQLWCTKAMIITDFHVNSNFQPKPGTVYKPEEIYLKTYPHLKNGQRQLALSFFYEGDAPAPKFSSITIKLMAEDKTTRKKRLVDLRKAPISNESYANGYLIITDLPGYEWNGDEYLEANVDFVLQETGKKNQQQLSVIAMAQ